MSYKRSDNVGAAKKKIKGSDFLISQPFEFTEKQQEVIDCILHYKTKALFIKGEAGTGKSGISIYAALTLLQKHSIDKIFYVRNIIESTHAPIGLLPGSSDEKISAYMEPLIDHLENMLSIEEINTFIKDKKINPIPCSFLRGKNFVKSLVLVDEAQNLTHKELVTVISRVCEDSKILFLFDPHQSDMKSAKNRNDISVFADIFNTEQAKVMGIEYREFNEDDIKRSEFVRFVISELKRVGKY